MSYTLARQTVAPVIEPIEAGAFEQFGPRYPHVIVALPRMSQLKIVVAVNKAMRDAGIPRAERGDFLEEATDPDLGAAGVMGVVRRYVTVALPPYGPRA